jgi:hypothetical protein
MMCCPLQINAAQEGQGSQMCSTRWVAVSTLRRVLQDEQSPLPWQT